ncbi:MAG: hypothetical protein ABIG61_08455 [Planctomycetota bacterium]
MADHFLMAFLRPWLLVALQLLLTNVGCGSDSGLTNQDLAIYDGPSEQNHIAVAHTLGCESVTRTYATTAASHAAIQITWIGSTIPRGPQHGGQFVSGWAASSLCEKLPNTSGPRVSLLE